MLNEFWDKEKDLIEFTGIIAALSGIFLNITQPYNEKASVALTNLKVFFLLVFLIFLIKLFYSFIKMIFSSKMATTKYILPMRIFQGLFFVWVFGYIILNLLSYIINFDSINASYSVVVLVFSFIIIWFLR